MAPQEFTHRALIGKCRAAGRTCLEMRGQARGVATRVLRALRVG
jgi:hypothetical protein